jgi:DNA-binding transcriptional LysR family regulator
MVSGARNEPDDDARQQALRPEMPTRRRLCSASMDVELRHLRAFAAVATHRSFTAASRELLIGQPGLTRTIQQLEAALGVRLLARTSRSVQLTEVGQDFLDRTRAVLADLDRAILAARGEQELRLGFQWVLPDPWATETITGFEQATGVTVTLLRRDDIDTALEAGDLDVAITRTRLTASGTVQTPLFDEDRVAAVSTRFPLAKEGVIDWLDLAGEPVVVNTVSGTTQPDSWPAEHRPTRVVTCGNYDEWLQLVASGRGVGAVPRSAARAGTHPGVTFVPLTGAPPVSVCLAYRPRRSNPLVRQFVTFAATAAPAQPR